VRHRTVPEAALDAYNVRLMRFLIARVAGLSSPGEVAANVSRLYENGLYEHV
jgi:hypothetical protein